MSNGIPGQAPTYHGHLYVIEFGDGTMKVGYSQNPRKRIEQHRHGAARFSIEVARKWVSDCHLEYVENERELIGYARQRGDVASGAEYFRGCEFSDLVEFASSLPSTRLSKAEVTRREQEENERLKERWKGAFAPLLPPREDLVPPFLEALFHRSEEVFPLSADSVDEPELLMKRAEELAETTGKPIDEILEWDHLDVLEHIATSMVRARILEHRIWALKNGRENLLVTGIELLT